MNYEWKEGCPPKDGKTYPLRFSGGIICSGTFRAGWTGEPQPEHIDWRCDCCGRFATPYAYLDIVSEQETK